MRKQMTLTAVNSGGLPLQGAPTQVLFEHRVTGGRAFQYYRLQKAKDGNGIDED